MSNPSGLTPEERDILLNGAPKVTRECETGDANSSSGQNDEPTDGPVDAETCEALTNIYRDFAMRLAAELTNRLRCETHINNLAIIQPSYGEFIFSMLHPTCLHVVKEPSCDSAWLIELHPKVVFPMLDRLLGGGKLPATMVRRPLTEIETRLVSRMMRDVLAELTAAWRPVTRFAPQLDRIENNPKLVRESHPGEPMVMVEMDIEFGDQKGSLRIAMAAEDILAKREAILDPQGPAADQVTMSISLAESIVPESRLESLKIGDIISTETDPNQLATIYIDGEPRYLGVPGTSRGKKAIRIERAIEK